jgi:hypothetical protein
LLRLFDESGSATLADDAAPAAASGTASDER